jgi:methyltransferase (TIGR00027 family)
VRRGIATGAQQVVVLGAGLDTLAARLHREFPQVKFIEIDRAETQEVKRRALMGQWAAGRNLVLVSADPARDRLEHKLPKSVYVAGAPTLFVAEDTLASMGDANRDALFNYVHAVGGPASSMVFTAMERGPDGRVRFRGTNWLARLRWARYGNRGHWGPSRVELEDYLGRHGLRLVSVLTAKDFRVRYLDGNPDVPLAEGEDIAVASA